MADQIFNVECGFFDSVNKDRLYTAEEMNRPYKRVITNGVFATPQGTASTDLQILSASDGMKIIVKKGEGLFGDKWFENPTDFTIVVPNNTNIVPRRDSVIVQIDKRQNGRVGSIVYREGTPASSPVPPDIGTVDNVIEYRIANIYVAAGATAINQDAIVDLRGSSECPWVTSLIKQVDTSTLFAQWQAAYQNYYDTTTQEMNSYITLEKAKFEEFLAGLTEDLTISTTLVTFDSHYTTTENNTTIIPIGIASYNKDADILYVFINGLKAVPTVDYSISSDSANITLTKPLRANQSISFLALQSVFIGDPETAITKIQELDTKISPLLSDSGWTNFTLESGATSFDTTTTPAVRKSGNQVFIRGAIKGLDTVNTPIATLPTNMRPTMNHQFVAIAFANNTIAANCVIEVKTTGTIVIAAKSGTIPATAMLPIATQFILN